MFDITRPQIIAAVEDMRGGVKEWRLWGFLAWQEIKQRYRRSTLGPFWMSANMALQMATMGLLVGKLFGHTYGKFLPYVCAGFIVWNYIGGTIIQGANAFVSSQSYIQQMHRPFHSYILLSIWRGFITLWHDMIVFVGVLIIFAIPPTLNILWFFVALPVVTFSVSWIALLLATIAVRFRDVPPLLQNGMNVLFWLTPIIYYADQLGDKAYLLLFNPLTHVVILLRDPLLGTAPSLINWIVAIGFGTIGWGIAFLVFARFRSRIAYWL